MGMDSQTSTRASLADETGVAVPSVSEFRNVQIERERIRELFRLIPDQPRDTALDIGARDGYLSLLLAERFAKVTALDLEMPNIPHPAITCVRGDAAALEFPDRTFDLVLCAEVLEHIPTHLLRKVCAELARVTKGHLLIGVPYDQDTRLGRTTCSACGAKNPPYGHVNVFNELNMEMLFPTLKPVKSIYVGKNQERTNWLSAKLNDWAGNPYGTYEQDEGCVECGTKLVAPSNRNPLQRVCGKISHHVQRIQSRIQPRQANWIHVLYAQIPG